MRHAPALSIVPHIDDEQLLARHHATLLAHPPDIVVVTTGIGFRGWIEAADAAGCSTSSLARCSAGARIVARGPKARGAIQAAGLTADWVAESETARRDRSTCCSPKVSPAARIAVQHHGAGADGLDEALAAAGADVVEPRRLPLGSVRRTPPPAASVHAARRGRDRRRRLHLGARRRRLAGRGRRAGPWTPGSSTRLRVRHAWSWPPSGPVTAKPLQDSGIAPLVPDRGRLGALVRTLVGHSSGSVDRAARPVAGPLQVRRTVALLDGHVLPVSPDGLEVLRLLADAGGDVVTRDAGARGAAGRLRRPARRRGRDRPAARRVRPRPRSRPS